MCFINTNDGKDVSMKDGISVVALAAGMLMGIGFTIGVQDTSQNKMCSGQPKVVEMSDTVRTFTCEVKLKKGE